MASRNVSLSVNLTWDSASCLEEGVKPPEKKPAGGICAPQAWTCWALLQLKAAGSELWCGTDTPRSLIHHLPPLAARQVGGKQLVLPLEEGPRLSTAPLSSPNLV